MRLPRLFGIRKVRRLESLPSSFFYIGGVRSLPVGPRVVLDFEFATTTMRRRHGSERYVYQFPLS